MVYKKYIKRGNRVYGPYLYHSVKKDGKVTTHYLGRHNPGKNKTEHSNSFFGKGHKTRFFLAAGFLSLLIIALTINLVYLIELAPTGRISMDIQENYIQGDYLTGTLRLILKYGELIPPDSQLIVDNVGNISNFTISDLLIESQVNGSFYIENTSVSGFGEGYGVIGEKEIYPLVHLKFRVVDKETGEIVPVRGGEEPGIEPLKPEENITVPENVREGVLEQNITEPPEENITEEPPLEEPSTTEIPEEPTAEQPQTPVEETLTTETPQEPSSTLEPEPASVTSSSEAPSSDSGAGITGGIISGEIIEAEVAKDKPFTYEVGEGQTIEIIESSQEVSFAQEDNIVTITTDYSETEQGFGQDYLTNEIIYFPISLFDLNLKAQSGIVTFSFVYGNEILTSSNLDVYVEGEINETNITEINMTNMTLEQRVNYIFEREGISVDPQVIAKLILGERVRVIVKTRPEMSFIGKKLERLNNYEVVELDEKNLELLNGSVIREIVLDQKISLLITDSEKIIKSSQARDDFGLTGKGKKICIIDTGLDASVVPYSLAWDFVNNDTDASDDNGHGTQVAYIAKTIAPGSEILAAKVLDSNGNGYESDVLEGLQWCIENNADIISFSIGSGNYDGFCDENIVAELANNAVEQGVFVGAATGNDGSTMLKAPACASKVVRVAATTKQDEIASFSNVNEALDVFAPGQDISTKTIGGEDKIVSGTSMAVLMLTGSAALVLENETLSPFELRDRFKTTGFPIQYEDINISRIDVYNAIINNITMPLFNETLNQTNMTNITSYTTLAVPNVTLISPENNNLTGVNTATFKCNASDDGRLTEISLWGDFGAGGTWHKDQIFNIQPTGNVTGHYNTTDNGDGTFTITYQPNPSYGKDTYVYSWQSTSNFGESFDLNVRSYNGYSYSFLEFDLAPIMGNADIISATLTLYEYYYFSYNNVVWIYCINKSWNETNVTWSSKPSRALENYGSIQLGNPIGYKSCDVTGLIKDWTNRANFNYGLSIENDGFSNFDLYSSDYLIDPSKRPKLEITYSLKDYVAEFNVTDEGVFNWTCQAVDDGSNTAFANENRTIYMNVPKSNLVAPVNNYIVNNAPANISFNCSFEKVKPEISTFLYGNWSGQWKVNDSNYTINSDAFINIIFNGTNIPKGTYKWSCAANYTNGKLAFAPENRTLIIDSCLPPTQEDWNISTNCSFQNQVIYMSADKSINILSGGNLTLINSSLLMNSSSSHGSANIKVYSEGNMGIFSNSLIKAQGNNNFGFVVNSGANFSMRDSTLEDCGWADIQGQRGLEVYTTLVSPNFLSNTLKNNYVGIYLGDGSNGSIIAENNIYNNSYAGIYAGENSDNHTIYSNILHDTGDAIYLYKSKGNLIDHNIIYSTIKAVYLGLANENSVINNDIYNIGIGFYLFSSQNNKFSYNNITTATGSLPNGGAGIFLYGVSPHVINNIFSNNIIKNSSQFGIGAHNINTYSYNNTFFNNIIINNPVGVDFSKSSGFNSFNNLFTDNIIQNNTNYDIKIGSGGNNNTFINTTFTTSNITGVGGYINVYWYLDVNVTNSTGPLLGANVSGFNVTGNLSFTELTMQNGSISRKTLKEYFQDSTLRVNSTPYTINTTWQGRINLIQIPLNKSTLLTIVFDVVAPEVFLISPENGIVVNQHNVTFNCSAKDNIQLKNITLYGNWTGIWHANETKLITGNENSTTFSKNVSNEAYKWNCLACDTGSNCAFNNTNWTFSFESGSNITICRNLDKSNTIYSLQNDIISSATCFNVLTDNITLDCNGHKITGDKSNVSAQAVYASGRFNTTIKNCNITNFYVGIALSNSANNGTIFNNTFYGNGKAGIWIYNNSRFVNITNNSVLYTWASSSAQTGSYCNISENTREGGIFVCDSGSNTLKNNIIMGNGTSDYNGMHSGIVISNSNYTEVNSNTLYNVDTIGIYVYGSSNTKLLYNFESGTGTNNIAHTINAIELSYSNNCNISNNIIYNNTDYGIYLKISSDYTYIYNNTVKNNTHSSYTPPGIYISTSHNTILGNNVSDVFVGIRIEGVNNTLTNNVIKIYSGTGGIAMASSANNNNFTGNNITTSGISAHGIYSEGAVLNNKFMNNKINTSGTSASGFYLNSVSNSNFTGDEVTTYGGDTARGIYFESNSDNNIFRNINVTTYGVGGLFNPNAIFFGLSTGNNFYDLFISAVQVNDIYSQGNGINNLTNVTFNKSDIGFGSGSGLIYVKWYLDVNVTNSTGPLPGANVSAWDKNNNFVFSENTYTSGFITRQNLTEYFQNITGTYTYNNYTINTTKDGYLKDSRKLNITNSTRLDIVMEVDPCTPPITGNWSINTTCLLENKIIILNGNLTVQNAGNLTFKNVTLRMNGASSSNGGYGIRVNNGGKFYIKDASNITNGNDPNYRYFFIVNSETNFSMINSYLSYAGWQSISGRTGLEISSPYTQIINNTFKNNYDGLTLSSSYNNISNNIIIESLHYGIYFQGQSDNNTLLSNYIKSYKSNLYVYSGGSNNFILNNTLDSPMSNPATNVYINSIKNSNIVNNTIIGGDIVVLLDNCNYNKIINTKILRIPHAPGSFGILLQSSSNNTFSNINVSLEGGGYLYAYSFAVDFAFTSIGNEIIDSVISGAKIDVRSSYNEANNTLLNTIFDKSKVQVDGGVIYVKWYLDVNVTNSTGALPGANVSSWDKKNNFVFSENTTDLGFITRQNITEYFHNTTGPQHVYNNYTVNATKTPYRPFSRQLNITNSTQLNILLSLNNLPTVNLISPLNNTFTYNRTITFNWSGYDLDNDPLIYNFSLTAYSGSNPTSDCDSRNISTGSNNYTTIDLKCLYDHGYYYKWKVGASDDNGASWGNWSDEWILNIQALVSINLNVSSVNFGSVKPRDSNDTTDDSPPPFVLENNGNCFVNVTINASDLWQSVSAKNPSEYFKFKADNYNGEPGSFDWLKSITSWTQVPNNITQQLFLVYFNWSDKTDTAEIDLNITVPTEQAGNRVSNITFTASLGE